MGVEEKSLLSKVGASGPSEHEGDVGRAGNEQGGLDGHGTVFVVWVGGVIPGDGGVCALAGEGLAV